MEQYTLPSPRRENMTCVPGSFSLDSISSRVVTSSSSGACITITVLPTRLSMQPSFPSRLSRSPSKYEDRMALHGTEKPPSAGALKSFEEGTAAKMR